MSVHLHDNMVGSTNPRELAHNVKTYIDERVAKMRAGQTGKQFEGFSDADLMLELMARGYAVWRPKGEE